MTKDEKMKGKRPYQVHAESAGQHEKLGSLISCLRGRRAFIPWLFVPHRGVYIDKCTHWTRSTPGQPDRNLPGSFIALAWAIWYFCTGDSRVLGIASTVEGDQDLRS